MFSTCRCSSSHCCDLAATFFLLCGNFEGFVELAVSCLSKHRAGIVLNVAPSIYLPYPTLIVHCVTWFSLERSQFVVDIHFGARSRAALLWLFFRHRQSVLVIIVTLSYS